MPDASAPGARLEPGAELREQQGRHSREAAREHEAQPDGVADVQVQPVGEDEARGGLGRSPRVRPPTLQHLPAFDGGAEAGVGRRHREDVGGPDGAAVAQLPGEEEADTAPGRGRHLRKPVDLVQVDRPDQPEAALAGDEDVAGVLRQNEPRVRRLGPSRTGHESDHDARADPGDQRHGEPGQPAGAQLGADAHPCRDHGQGPAMGAVSRWAARATSVRSVLPVSAPWPALNVRPTT